MINFLKRKKEGEQEPEQVDSTKQGLFGRLKKGLNKTRQAFTEDLANSLLGKKTIDANLLEEIETTLLTADLGVEVTSQLLTSLENGLARKEISDGDAVFQALKNHLNALLVPISKPLITEMSHSPYVILMIGVNGAGKTTTIGKLAKQLKNKGKSVMLAAGDTFRAAAIEQLQAWGERNDIPVVSQQSGSDSASVIFDAMQSAKAKNIDVLIADTAGRLHTQSNLMEELKKIKRVIQKVDDTAPHEVMLVLDASIGQNALQQAKQFSKAINVTGITLTKLDGTAKGGIIFAIANQLNIPIRFIGIGENIDDLRTFDASDFVDALF